MLGLKISVYLPKQDNTRLFFSILVAYFKAHGEYNRDMKSKTIILSGENENGRGIVTLTQEEDFLSVRLRLYNIERLNSYCKIGVYHDGKAYSANLLEKNGAYLSSIVGDFNIDSDFYSAVIDTSADNKVIVSGGTYGGCFFNDTSVFTLDNPNANYVDVDLPAEKDEIGVPDKTSEGFNTGEQCEHADCANCKYKEYFYSCQEPINHGLQKEVESSQENNIIEQTKQTNEIEQFQEQKKSEFLTGHDEDGVLQSLVPQFKYVFENYPVDEKLSKLLPNGKFVEICEGHSRYSIGALYEVGEMKYICYAREAEREDSPPSELGEHYQWLPIDKDDPLSSGYFIVFQDARDLKIVEF